MMARSKVFQVPLTMAVAAENEHAARVYVETWLKRVQDEAAERVDDIHNLEVAPPARTGVHG